YYSPGQGGEFTNFVMVNGVGRTFNLLQASGGLPPPHPPWAIPGSQGRPPSWGNLVANPGNGPDPLPSPATRNIIAPTDQGKTWFDIGTPATFGSPGSTSYALAYGAPDPGAPAGVGNLNNFLYVGTATGRVFVSRDAGGHWAEISTGLDTSSIKQIITD